MTHVKPSGMLNTLKGRVAWQMMRIRTSAAGHPAPKEAVQKGPRTRPICACDLPLPQPLLGAAWIRAMLEEKPLYQPPEVQR